MIPAVTRWIAAAGAGVISLDSIINVAFPAMAAAFAQPPGRALGFLNAGIGVGFTVGPLVAGLLVAHLGWRSTFYVRVPIALGVFGWALAGLPAARGAATRLVAAADVLRRAVLAPGALAVVANAPIFAGWRLAPFYPGAVRGPA